MRLYNYFYVCIHIHAHDRHAYLLPYPSSHAWQDKYAATRESGRGLAWRAGGLVAEAALAECVERHLSLRCIPLAQGGGRVAPVMVLSCSSPVVVGVRQQQQVAQQGRGRGSRDEEDMSGMSVAAMLEFAP